MQLDNKEKKSLKRILQDLSDQRNQYKTSSEQERDTRVQKHWNELVSECSADRVVLLRLFAEIGFDPYEE